jgi:protein translocase SecG subunit
MFWTTVWWIFLILYIPACVGLIVIVLLQKGKGTGFAGAFGLGSGGDTVFGPRAAKSLPVRLTYTMAALYLVLALAMSLLGGRIGKGVAPEYIPEDDTWSTTLEGIGTQVEDGEEIPGGAALPVEFAPVESEADSEEVPSTPSE